LTINLQKDKQQLLDLALRHHNLLEELQTSQAVLGEQNIKFQEEANQCNTKTKEAEQKIEILSQQILHLEEELFVNMALSYKLAKMDQPNIPILTSTIGELYAQVKEKKLPKTEWGCFIVSALNPPPMIQPSNLLSEPTVHLDTNDEYSKIATNRDGISRDLEMLLLQDFEEPQERNVRLEKKSGFMKTLDDLSHKLSCVFTYR